MTTTTLTLAAFVLARVEEKAAAASVVGVLHTGGCLALVDGTLATVPCPHRIDPPVKPTTHERRVLAECKAVRRIVEVHADNGFGEFCLTCVDLECLDEQADYPCPTLRILAAVWADHDLYREEWRP